MGHDGKKNAVISADTCLAQDLINDDDDGSFQLDNAWDLVISLVSPERKLYL